MKKIRILTLVLMTVCLCAFLFSCGEPENICTHEYDNTYCDTKCSLCAKPYNEKGHAWMVNSAIQCQHQGKCVYCGLIEGEDILEHLFVDENGNVLEKCARCNAINPDFSEPTPEANTATFQYTYDYGWHIVGKLTLLCDSGRFDSTFGRIEVPEDIVAGDIIKIVYTGEMWTQESYPCKHVLNGEVISYSFEYAPVIHLSGDEFSIEKIKGCYDYDEEYVILDRSGEFVSLNDYTGTEIYLVTDQQKYAKIYENIDPEQEDVPDVNYPIASMFAYDPRNLEDGVVYFPENEEGL